jgi:hypothetical protein
MFIWDEYPQFFRGRWRVLFRLTSQVPKELLRVRSPLRTSLPIVQSERRNAVASAFVGNCPLIEAPFENRTSIS